MARNRPWLIAVTASLVVLTLGAGLFVRVPYYLISPGAARGVAQLIEIDGDEARVYEPEGEVLFTTVSLTGNLNAYQVLLGWADDEVEVVPAEQITGGKPREQVREINIAAMDESKLTATKVALEKIGYSVSVEGDGAVVTEVGPKSPAAGQLIEGDVITAVDGEKVALSSDLVRLVRQRRAGDVIELAFKRSEEARQVSVTAADAGDGVALLGVMVQTANVRYRLPFEVNIDTGLVGGPSAGLAFTLALIDELTPGELTGGGSVAVTGTIASDGRVGPVGGAAQKAVTARRAGARIFLVPPDELTEARRFAGQMDVVAVETLDQALAALEELGGSGVALSKVPPDS